MGKQLLLFNSLEDLARDATPGPWVAHEGHLHVLDSHWTILARVPASPDDEHRPDLRDLRFIAAANPSTVLSLVQALRDEKALRAQLASDLQTTHKRVIQLLEHLTESQEALAMVCEKPAPDCDCAGCTAARMYRMDG